MNTRTALVTASSWIESLESEDLWIVSADVHF
jgi:hypothetical protein